MAPRRPFAALLVSALLALALPTAAIAQSAGDNQYSDPLQGGSGSSGGSGGHSGSSGSSHQSQGGGSSSGSGTSTPATPSSSSGSAGTQAAGKQSASAGNGRAVPLARTGFDALVPAIAGLLLLAGGGALLIGSRRQAPKR